MTETAAMMEDARQRSRTYNIYAWPHVMYKTPAPEFTSWWEEESGWNYTASVWNPVETPSGFGNLVRITGPDAANLISDTCVNRVHGSKPGTIKNLVICNDNGKVVCDTMCLVYGENEFEITSGNVHFRYTMQQKHYDVTLEPLPSRTSMQVAGPKSFELLQELTDEDLSQIKFGHFKKIIIGGVETTMVRVTMTGELGFELQAQSADHDRLFSQVLETGKKYGLQRLGIRNHLVQHAEGGISGIYYCDMVTGLAAGGDDPYYRFCMENHEDMCASGLIRPKIAGSYEPKSYEDFMASPFEMGLGRLVNFSHEFRGKAALLEEKEHPKRRFVCLEWNKEDVVDVYASLFREGPSHERNEEPHYDYMELPRNPRLPIEASRVLADGRDIAFTTSRTYMYSFRRMVSNCMIPVEYAEPGTQVTILWGEPGHPQKEIRATVAASPYKPNRTKSLPTD